MTVFLQYYLSIYVIPIVNNIKPPINVDTLPYFLFKIFPRFKPKYVNIKLIIENIEAANMDLFVIAGNPIPVVKLSMLTDSPNIKYPGILIRNFSSFSLKLYIIISMAISDSIIPTTIVELNIILFSIYFPIVSPINGIIK